MMEIIIEMKRPFSNGTEFDRWTERNCDKCSYRVPNHETPILCPIQSELGFSSVSSGEVRKPVYDLLGLGNGGECVLFRDRAVHGAAV